MLSRDQLISEGFMPITDIFDSVDSYEAAYRHIDNSSLALNSFTTEQAMDFIHSPASLKKSYSDSNVLGIMEGIFFMPNGYSRNKRFYSESLWRSTIEASYIKDKLSRGDFLGMFEHPGTRLAETSDGLITSAHPINAGIVTKNLRIVEHNGVKYGIGKSYILNTPVGNAINVMLKSKDEDGKSLIKLAVSSRALARSTGKDNQGNEVLDAKSYYLESFDVVVNPGIAEAFPEYRIIESALTNACKCIGECEDQKVQALRESLNLKYI